MTEEKSYTPPPITGYRVLTTFEVDLINEIKAKGDDLGKLIERMRLLPEPMPDKRWLAIGTTHIQEGIMALVRSVAQPTNF